MSKLTSFRKVQIECDQLANANQELEEKVLGLKNDVKQAEQNYESKASIADTLVDLNTELRNRLSEKDAHISSLASELGEANAKLRDYERRDANNRSKHERLKADFMRTLGWVNAKLDLHPLAWAPAEVEARDRFSEASRNERAIVGRQS